MNKITINKIKESIQAANKIAVMTHKNPDGDGLGSLTAMAELLQIWDKNYVLFCITPAPTYFDFLSNINELQTNESVIKNNRFDLIIVLDSGSLPYAGVKELLDSLTYKFKLINIDHHASNDLFGSINLVDDQASSTCEIIYQLFRTWKIPFNRNIATSLLNGIVTDTGLFSNPATTDNCIKIAGYLMKFGANLEKIKTYNWRNKEPNTLKLWGLAMQRLIYNSDLNSVTTYLTRQDGKKLDIDIEKLEGLANFLSSLQDINFTLVLVERGNNTIKGSLRTTKDDIDVGALAKALGGGGHKKAAGFVIPGKLAYNNGEIQIV